MATVKVDLKNTELFAKILTILQDLLRDKRVNEEVRQDYGMLIEYVLNGGDGTDEE